jgi:hypothetical protein
MVSVYEKERAVRIERNQAILRSLGIDKMILKPVKRFAQAKKCDGPFRRSSRVATNLSLRAQKTYLKEQKRNVRRSSTLSSTTTVNLSQEGKSANENAALRAQNQRMTNVFMMIYNSITSFRTRWIRNFWLIYQER